MKTLAKALILVVLTSTTSSPVYGQANSTSPQTQGVSGTDPRPQGVSGTDPRSQSIWAAVLQALGL